MNAECATRRDEGKAALLSRRVISMRWGVKNSSICYFHTNLIVLKLLLCPDCLPRLAGRGLLIVIPQLWWGARDWIWLCALRSSLLFNESGSKKGKTFTWCNRCTEHVIPLSFRLLHRTIFCSWPIVTHLPSLHHHYEPNRRRRARKGGRKTAQSCCLVSFHINKPYGTNFPPHHHQTQINFKFIQNTMHSVSLALMWFPALLTFSGGLNCR